MDTLHYDFFLKVLTENGRWLDETSFYFADDPEQEDHWLGCLPNRGFPSYWVGNCDIPDGREYDTAQELLEAPIFHRRSLRDRWSQVRLVSIMGISLDSWYEYYCKLGDEPCPRSGPIPFQSE